MLKTTTLRLAALLMACGGAPALAAPATPEEAQRLATLLGSYVGHPAGQPSAVTVVPHGEGYTASLDLGRLISFLGDTGVSITAGPLAAELTPQADGRWHVLVDGLPSIGIAQGETSASVVYESYTFDGVFDPAIRAFATVKSTGGGLSVHTTSKTGPLDVKIEQTSVGTMQAEDGGAGMVNMTSQSSSKAVRYAVSVPAGSPPTAVSPAAAAVKVAIASLDLSGITKGVPLVAIEDLWQFLVAHPSKAALAANEADLKMRLKALVPSVWSANSDLKVAQVAVDTTMGSFGLDALAIHQEGSSADDAHANLTRWSASGPHLPPGLVPPWAAPLLPTSIDIGESYGPIDVRPGLLLAIDDLDLAADKPLTDQQQATIAEAFNAGNKVLTIAPSSIVMPTMTLKFSGETKLTKPLPTGSGTIFAIGLDRTIDAVRTAAPNDPQAAQVIAVLMAAKATGKAEGPDSYSWAIQAAPGGTVTINGVPLPSGGAAPGQPGKPRKGLIKPL